MNEHEQKSIHNTREKLRHDEAYITREKEIFLEIWSHGVDEDR